jgi:twinkle protein
MLTTKAQEILSSRGLEPELLSRFGWSSKDDNGTDVWIEIPFFVGTDIVNRKSRTIAGEKKFYQEANARKVFWNFNALTDSTLKNEPVIITEGEIDALTAIQCGYSRTVSVPDGAPATALGERDTEKYSYIADALPLLKDEREIILAVDGDAAGNNLLHDLAIRLGNPRCKWVRYPKGRDGRQLKDLNEAFMEYGERGVTETIRQAKFVKTNGAYKMSELPPFEEQPVLRVGFPGLDERFGIRRADFIVITGAPSGGKSTVLTDIACRMASNHGWKTAFASFEQHPRADHYRNLKKWFYGWGHSGSPDQWIDDNFVFLVPDEDELPDLNWFLTVCEMAVICGFRGMAISIPK